MSVEEVSKLFHELAVEEESANVEAAKMDEFSSEDREFVRQELAWLANFLRRKHKLSVQKVRRILREMLDVAV